MRKTTFRVSKKVWELFDATCKTGFLRRDAYLNHTLPEELELLEKLQPNDDEAYQWIKNTWFGRDGPLRSEATHFISVLLDDALIERINHACEQRRIPRDA